MEVASAVEGLTPKQRAFLERYLVSWNASDAAREAGYSQPKQQGSRLLTKVDIQAAIRERLNEMTMPANEVLARLTAHAQGDLSAFLTQQSGGKIEVDLAKAEREGKMHLLKSYRETAHGISIELHNPQNALELLGRHYGLFTDNLNLSGEVSVKGYVEVSPDDWDDTPEG